MTSISTRISQYLLMSGLSLLPLMVNQFIFLDESRESRTRTSSRDSAQEFDFIVVGAGTSGSVLAKRLSQNFSVLLLEAGGDPFPLMEIPGMASLFPTNPNYDWAYRTVPQQKACLSLNNRESLWSSGKALGGSTNLNYLAYIRGHHLDYDNWAQITGDERWSYNNFLKYFKKIENYHVTSKGKMSEKYFGKGGEIDVNSTPYRSLAKYFFDAVAEIGYNVVKDINLPFDEAFGNFSYTIRNGRRWGTYAAFLKRDRLNPKSNLTIYKYSTATKVLLTPSNQAHAVEYEYQGKLYTVKASKEIILSAGTVGTPKLLMLSGIGPKNHLKSIGIPVKVDLPVGENLQDHIVAFVGPFTIIPKLTFVSDRDAELRKMLTFLQDGTGPLTSSGIEATGLIRSSYSKNVVNITKIWPDMQLILAVFPLPRDGPERLSQIFNLRPEIAEAYYRPVAGTDSFHIMSVLSRPKSRGNIKLASADHRDPPLIDPKYLENPRDMDIILEGVKKILRIVHDTKAFKKIGAKLSPTPFPSCNHLQHRSQAYWKCYLENFTLTVYHPSGSCAMGKPGSGTAVLDSSLRVFGVRNLRVGDASIMPEIVSSNPQAACLAIGEIGAEFIKESWLK